MRWSLIAPLGIAAFVGIMSMDMPDANALARRTTVVSGPRGAAVISRRGRVVSMNRLRGARGAVIVSGRRGIVRRGRFVSVRGFRGARGAVICRTAIVNGRRVRRCF